MRDATIGKSLVLAVHPTSRGFGWVLFKGPLKPTDWGMASARKGRNAKLFKRFERILNRHKPQTLVLESFAEGGTARVDRIQDFCREIRHIGACMGIETRVYRRNTVQRTFASTGAVTRFEIAGVIAERIDALNHRLPPKRKRWMSQDPRQSLFDAAALAITYFAHQGANPFMQ